MNAPACSGRDDTPKLQILPNPAAVAARGAAHVAAQARAAIAERGRFTLAVSGGRTPWAMFARLAEQKLPWSETAIFQVDERIAPAGDPDRNLSHLRASLPEHADAELHPMPVEEDDLIAAAERYARSLPERFDLVHLGLGPDGHTASLVPGDPALEISDRDVALTQPYMGRRRMTLTYAALNRARGRLWLITGADKTEALKRLRSGDRSIPAGRVSAANALILADVAAAGEG